MAFLNVAILLSLLLGIFSAKVDVNNRLNCIFSEKHLNEESCKAQGCIWSFSNVGGEPQCYLNRTAMGYISSGTIMTPHSLDSTLKLKASARKATSLQQIQTLKLTVTSLSEHILRIRLVDSTQQRYEVPIQSQFNIPRPFTGKTEYEISLRDGDFHLNVTRRSNGLTLLDTSIGGLIYSDQFIQFATYLASKDVYGFGENYHLSFKRSFDYTTEPIFAHGHVVGTRKVNYYGHHPFFTVTEGDGKSHGIFLLNSNAMAYTLLPSPGVSLQMTGGILDLFLFVGDHPEHVVQLYTSLIGRPIMPPFWGLGFQQCRWGYQNLEEVKKVVARTLKHKVPFDTQYLDIDYMDEYRDFTYSRKHFAGLPAFINETKEKNDLHWTLILDPAIQADKKGYLPFEEGYKRDVFIKWPKELANSTLIGHPKNVPTDKGVLYGKVWPDGPVAFPDFFKNATGEWWKEMIQRMGGELKIDALWIDMNEPYNFDSDWYTCPADKYQISHPQLGFNDSIDTATVCMSARQGDEEQYRHYDVHSLYGWSETEPTLRGLREATGKRGFVVSRSTFASSARYGTHWLGDNESTWEQLRQSIIGLLEFSLFGFSFIGHDICGFNGNSTAELCRRWYQLGAYYPFSRSHNSINTTDQDPGFWAENGHPEVTQAAKDALETRYQLLHYLYTRFYRSYAFGETVFRPMHHVFPEDTASRNIDQQFFLGPSIMVNPFLYQNQTFVKAYVPPDSEWYQMSGDFVSKAHLASGHVQLSDAESDRPFLIRAGSILPVVSHRSLPDVINTVKLRKVPIELWVLPAANGAADGDLFFDDGDSIETVESGNYNFYKFTLEHCQLRIEMVHSGYKALPSSQDILRVSAINVALANLKAISSENMQVTVSGTFAHQAIIQNETLLVKFFEPFNLLHLNNQIVIQFYDKNTKECITH